jgi:hypothetical protein
VIKVHIGYVRRNGKNQIQEDESIYTNSHSVITY